MKKKQISLPPNPVDDREDIYKRLDALGVTNVVGKRECNEALDVYDDVLIKAYQKSEELGRKIAHAAGIRVQLKKSEDGDMIRAAKELDDVI